MLQLDPLTLLFSIACMALLMSGVSFTLARAHPGEDYGLALWGWAMAAGSGAFALISMRGQLGLVSGFLVANALVLALPALGAGALSRLVRARRPPWLLLLALAALGYAGVVAMVVFGLERRVAATTMALALTGMLAVCTWQVLHQPRAQQRASSWVMCVMLGTMTLAFAFRALTLLSGSVDASPTSGARSHITVLLLGGGFINGASLGYFFMVQDRLRLEAQERARRDPLTGLYTRAGFHELAGTWLLGPDTGECAVLLLDVDHFKSVNDTHGHAAGDRLLARLGGLLAEHCGDEHLACRYGGEEFCLLVRRSSRTAAAQFAQRLVQAAAAQTLPQAAGEPLRFTVSVGHTLRLPGEPLEAAIERADGALYAAKRGGRNRACGAPPELPAAGSPGPRTRPMRAFDLTA